jgi:hypothetical protein
MSAAELILATGSEPATPASGRVTLYAGSDDQVYAKDSAGNVSKLVTPDAAQTFTAAQTFSDDVLLGGSGKQVGFYGTTPAGKPSVSGSRGGNAALTSLLTALANLGLLTDSSTS